MSNGNFDELIENILFQCVFALGCGAQMSIKRSALAELKDHCGDAFKTVIERDDRGVGGLPPGEQKWDAVKFKLLDACENIGKVAALKATAANEITIGPVILKEAYMQVKVKYEPGAGEYCPDF